MLDQPSACFNPRMKPESSMMRWGVASASRHSMLSNKFFKISTIAGGVLSGPGGR